MIVQLIAQVIVIVTNYILSKFMVFRKKKAEPEAGTVDNDTENNLENNNTENNEKA